MLHVQHLRFPTTDEGSTFGLIALPDGSRWVTVEQVWADNAVGKSCWPPGLHVATVTYSPRFKRDLYLVHVEGRSGMRLHPANFAYQLRGCCALGLKIAQFPSGEWGVTNSRSSIDEFMHATGGQPLLIETTVLPMLL